MKLKDVPTLKLAQVGEEIHKELACKMVKDYQDTNATDVKSYFIGKNILAKILDQPDCAGINFYNAINELGQKTLVYVGLDQSGQIIDEITLVNKLGKIDKTPGIIADRVKIDVEGDDGSLSSW